MVKKLKVEVRESDGSSNEYRCHVCGDRTDGVVAPVKISENTEWILCANCCEPRRIKEQFEQDAKDDAERAKLVDEFYKLIVTGEIEFPTRVDCETVKRKIHEDYVRGYDEDYGKGAYARSGLSD